MNAELQTPYLVCEDLRYLRRCYLLIRRRCNGIFFQQRSRYRLSVFFPQITQMTAQLQTQYLVGENLRYLREISSDG